MSYRMVTLGMEAQALKIIAAAKALEFVKDGMNIGIGTGSTANEFIRLLSVKVSQGMRIQGVSTSERSTKLCLDLGVPITTLDECPELDLAFDGADEIGPNLALIKGGGGALLREKIVATAAHSLIVIADESKLVENIGRFPLPIEVNPFGLRATSCLIEKVAAKLNLSGSIVLRQCENNKPYITDGGHYILDASFSRILMPEILSQELLAIPGVVEHGLFLGLASYCIVAMKDGTIKSFEKDELN